MTTAIPERCHDGSSQTPTGVMEAVTAETLLSMQLSEPNLCTEPNPCTDQEEVASLCPLDPSLPAPFPSAAERARLIQARLDSRVAAAPIVSSNTPGVFGPFNNWSRGHTLASHGTIMEWRSGSAQNMVEYTEAIPR